MTKGITNVIEYKGALHTYTQNGSEIILIL